MEETSKNNENAQLGIGAVACRYYNAGGIGLGVVGVCIDSVKHQDSEYTFLTGKQPEYQWIRTEDLYDTYEEAKNAPVARFSNGR